MDLYTFLHRKLLALCETEIQRLYKDLPHGSTTITTTQEVKEWLQREHMTLVSGEIPTTISSLKSPLGLWIQDLVNYFWGEAKTIPKTIQHITNIERVLPENTTPGYHPHTLPTEALISWWKVLPDYTENEHLYQTALKPFMKGIK